MATEENTEAKAEAEEKNSSVKNIVHIMEDENSYINSAKAVSYTHLTLPTILRV